MISDFSSIIFEYAFTFKRPVITFNQNINLEQYDASDLDEKTWKYEVWNKIGLKVGREDIVRIGELINQLLNENMADIIKEEANQYWKNQGKCVQNIVDYIEKKLFC